MGICWVPLCSHKGEKNQCRMFPMPKDDASLKRWKKLIRRSDAEPNQKSRVCSCHFKNGDKSAGPTIFPWNKQKQFAFITPEKKKRRVPRVPINLDVVPGDEVFPHEMMDVDNEEGVNRRQGAPNVARNLEFGPENEGPEDEGPVNKGPEDEGPENKGPEDEGPENKGPENEGPETEGPENEGPETEGPENEGPENKGPENEGPLNKGPENSREMEDLLEQIRKLQAEVKEWKEKVLINSSVLHEAENRVLREEVLLLKEQLKGEKDVFLFRKIAGNNAKVSHYTGLPNKETFFALLKLFDNFEIQYQKGWKVKKLDKENQLFLTLIKLRRNLSNEDLAERFKIDSTTVSNIFKSWLMALHHVCFKTLMATVPPREKNLSNLPACFAPYPSTRLVIDCTEVTSASPKLLKDQNRMWSNYKHKITSKGCIGVLPSGTIAFVSKLFPGSTSDKKIVIESKILDCLVPGDSIMADKGFLIADILPDGVSLNIPPIKDTPQFTEEQVEEGKKVSRARIHVERAISRLKRFQILQYIPQFVGKYASEIFQVCAALVNFQNGLLKECTDSDAATDADE